MSKEKQYTFTEDEFLATHEKYPNKPMIIIDFDDKSTNKNFANYPTFYIPVKILKPDGITYTSGSLASNCHLINMSAPKVFGSNDDKASVDASVKNQEKPPRQVKFMFQNIKALDWKLVDYKASNVAKLEADNAKFLKFLTVVNDNYLEIAEQLRKMPPDAFENKFKMQPPVDESKGRKNQPPIIPTGPYSGFRSIIQDQRKLNDKDDAKLYPYGFVPLENPSYWLPVNINAKGEFVSEYTIDKKNIVNHHIFDARSKEKLVLKHKGEDINLKNMADAVPIYSLIVDLNIKFDKMSVYTGGVSCGLRIHSMRVYPHRKLAGQPKELEALTDYFDVKNDIQEPYIQEPNEHIPDEINVQAAPSEPAAESTVKVESEPAAAKAPTKTVGRKKF